MIDMSVPYNQLLLSDGEAGRVTKPTNLSRQQLITELLHCGRPLIHCKLGWYCDVILLCTCSGCYGDVWSEVMETMAHLLSNRYLQVQCYYGHIVYMILSVVMVAVCSPSVMLRN